jgi:hypothetical protein
VIANRDTSHLRKIASRISGGNSFKKPVLASTDEAQSGQP